MKSYFSFSKQLHSLLRAEASSVCKVDSQNYVNFPSHDLLVYPNAVTTTEHDTLVDECERKLKREKYSGTHFDGMIQNYREVSVSKWSESVTDILQRLKQHHLPPSIAWKSIHVLDLNATGSIHAHADNSDYSGHYVCGLCLLSAAVMRFRLQSDPNLFVDALLEPGSFYVTR